MDGRGKLEQLGLWSWERRYCDRGAAHALPLCAMHAPWRGLRGRVVQSVAMRPDVAWWNGMLASLSVCRAAGRFARCHVPSAWLYVTLGTLELWLARSVTSEL
eukprot:2080638-Prymnesium_polylepis.1